MSQMCCESQRFRLWGRFPDGKRCFLQRNQGQGSRKTSRMTSLSVADAPLLTSAIRLRPMQVSEAFRLTYDQLVGD